jgi:hypothetical protein
MDWYELRFRCTYWFKRSWPFRSLAWLLSRGVPEEKGFGKFGGGSTLERLHKAPEIALTEGEVSSEYFLDKCGAEAGDTEDRPVDLWWRLETQCLHTLSAHHEREERYKTWLVGICVAGVAVAFALAMYAMRFL